MNDQKIITYGLKRLELTDLLTLTRDGNPILAVPDELVEDFIYLIGRTDAYDKMQSVKDPNDIPEEFHRSPKAM